jgi:hypothetical protein
MPGFFAALKSLPSATFAYAYNYWIVLAHMPSSTTYFSLFRIYLDPHDMPGKSGVIDGRTCSCSSLLGPCLPAALSFSPILLTFS